MKNNLSVVVCFVLLISTFSCKNKVEKKTITYEVTPEFCTQIKKPEVHFTSEIPENLQIERPKPGKKSFSYGMFQKKNSDSIVVQMYSYGYINADSLTLKTTGKTFFSQIQSLLESGGYKMSQSKIENVNFDNNNYLALQAIGNINGKNDPSFIGTYHFNIILKPNPYKNTHIIMIMAARDDQSISSFEDFKDQLDISTIWNSFTYLD